MNNNKPNSHGIWIGHYPGHFAEVVEIIQDGPILKAVKITGDDYVPAGELSWVLDLRTMKAQGQISELEFVKPRFVPASLVVNSRDKITVSWDCGDVVPSVEFHRDGI